jgi:hypothetical protein
MRCEMVSVRMRRNESERRLVSLDMEDDVGFEQSRQGQPRGGAPSAPSSFFLFFLTLPDLLSALPDNVFTVLSFECTCIYTQRLLRFDLHDTKLVGGELSMRILCLSRSSHLTVIIPMFYIFSSAFLAMASSLAMIAKSKGALYSMSPRSSLLWSRTGISQSPAYLHHKYEFGLPLLSLPPCPRSCHRI